MESDKEIIKLLLLLGFTEGEIQDLAKTQTDEIFKMLPIINRFNKDLL